MIIRSDYAGQCYAGDLILYLPNGFHPESTRLAVFLGMQRRLGIAKLVVWTLPGGSLDYPHVSCLKEVVSHVSECEG